MDNIPTIPNISLILSRQAPCIQLVDIRYDGESGGAEMIV